MREQLSLQQALQARFGELQAKNPNFSRRAFSKKLGISPGAISEIFNGRRKVAYKLARRITDRLGLDPQQRAELLSLYSAKHLTPQEAQATETVQSNYLQLSADQFHVVGEWYHFAILTLMRSKGFKSDPKWIAGRLGLSLTTATGALERLKRVGLIQNKGGRLVRSKTRYRTSDDVANAAVRRAHAQYLEKAREALETIPVELRDFTSLMMSIDPASLPQAKELIRKFQDELSALVEKKPQPQVYQLLIQLFPLTQIESQGDAP